jgi:dihydrofolate reductase
LGEHTSKTQTAERETKYCHKSEFGIRSVRVVWVYWIVLSTGVCLRSSSYRDSPQADPPPELHSSLKSALISLNSKASDDSRIFIIGGSSLYQESLSYPCIDRVLLTRILSPSYDCDVFFPTLDDAIWKNATYTELAEFVGDVAEDAQTEGDTTYEFQMYVRSP